MSDDLGLTDEEFESFMRVIDPPVVMRCHICGKEKEAESYDRATYLIAFHYDRRHPGWTHKPNEAHRTVVLPVDDEKAETQQKTATAGES